MLKVDNSMKQISVTRGDSINLKLKVKTTDGYYSFKTDDTVRFRVYEKKKLNESPVLEKIIKVAEDTEQVVIELSSTDTKIGEMVNKEVEYWYEVELNGSITLIGYSEDLGPAVFMLLPEGKEII